MPHVKLFGSRAPRTIAVPSPGKKGRIEIPNVDPATIHRESAFATMRKLRPHLKSLGKTTADLWEIFKNRYEVQSRSEFSPMQWATVAAELRAAANNRTLLVKLFAVPVSPDFIPDAADNYRVYAEDFNGRGKRIAELSGDTNLKSLEKRSLAYANRTGKIVRVVRQDIGYTQMFFPEDSDMPF